MARKGTAGAPTTPAADDGEGRTPAAPFAPGAPLLAGPGGANDATIPPPRPARRTRLARGPLTIGEPAVAITPLLGGGDPYRPDTVADGGAASGMTVRAASVRGLAKRYLSGPRQDDLCLRGHQPTATLIVAVADGVSGASSSDLGAALAVRHAVTAVARQLDAAAAGQGDASAKLDAAAAGQGDAGAGIDLDWGAVFEQAAWALVAERRRSDPRADLRAATAALATTLTVAVVASDRRSGGLTAQIAAIGDSPALALERDRFRPLLDGGRSSDGLVGAPVAALPRDLSALALCACKLAPGAILLLCSDGLALPLADGRGEVGDVFARELARVPDVIDFARLLDFSRATYDDDRTLVAVWPGAAQDSQTRDGAQRQTRDGQLWGDSCPIWAGSVPEPILGAPGGAPVLRAPGSARSSAPKPRRVGAS